MRKYFANIPLLIEHDLHLQIKQVAKETHLTQALVMRAAIRLGLPIFAAEFPKPQKYRRSLNKEYKRINKDWDRIERAAEHSRRQKA